MISGSITISTRETMSKATSYQCAFEENSALSEPVSQPIILNIVVYEMYQLFFF